MEDKCCQRLTAAVSSSSLSSSSSRQGTHHGQVNKSRCFPSAFIPPSSAWKTETEISAGKSGRIRRKGLADEPGTRVFFKPLPSGLMRWCDRPADATQT